MSSQERRLGLVHRVIASHHGMNEYAILITDRRSIFIQQARSQGGFALRTELLTGAWGRTSIKPKTLEDYSGFAIGSLELDEQNITVEHDGVTKLIIAIGGLFPVFHFDLEYRGEARAESLVFYAVPLGSYVTNGDQRPREVILRAYAESIFKLYSAVLPSGVIDDAGLGEGPEEQDGNERP